MPQKKVFPSELRVGDQVCYWAYSKTVGRNTLLIPSKVELSNEILSIRFGEEALLLDLAFGRVVRCEYDKKVTVLIDEPTVAQSHLGTAIKFRGVSIE